MANDKEVYVPRVAAEFDHHDERPSGLIILNADDFGMTTGICRGILQAWDRGAVTSTSAMVVGRSFDRFAARLRDSGLPTGCHLSVVGEDPPVLTAREIPTLTSRSGRFPSDWRCFVGMAAAGRIDSGDLRREFDAQMWRLHDAGIRPTHLDTHQNLHLWPQVAEVLVDVARSHLVTAMRVPRFNRRTPMSAVVRQLAGRLERRATTADLRVPRSSVGLDEMASLEPSEFHLVARWAACRGSIELIAHLGEESDPERRSFPTRFDWAGQLDAVCRAEVLQTLTRSGAQLGDFRDLTPAPSAWRNQATTRTAQQSHRVPSAASSAVTSS